MRTDASALVRIEIGRECMRLLKERDALPWWNFWRWAAINQEVQELIAILEEES